MRSLSRIKLLTFSLLIICSSLLVSACAGLNFQITEITDDPLSTLEVTETIESTTTEATTTESITEETTSATTPTTPTTTTVATTVKPTPAPTPTPIPTTRATTRGTTSPPATPTPMVSPDGRTGSQLDTPFMVNGIPIVSKNHWVSSNYQPLPISQENVSLVEPAWSQYQKMVSDAAALGMEIQFRTSYRSYQYQKDLFALRVSQWGEAGAARATARPGQSEHQTGLAIDVMSEGISGQAFKDTRAGIWLRENSWKYGFIIRYPEGKEHITGYVFEPWHFRYVGEQIAADFGPNSTLTLEEYFGIN